MENENEKMGKCFLRKRKLGIIPLSLDKESTEPWNKLDNPPADEQKETTSSNHLSLYPIRWHGAIKEDVSNIKCDRCPGTKHSPNDLPQTYCFENQQVSTNS